MPIYEYRCSSCGSTCEFLQRASEQPKTTCPHCQADALSRIISGVAVAFKGEGFHINDYQGSSSPQQSKTQATAAGTKDSSSSSPKSNSSSSD